MRFVATLLCALILFWSGGDTAHAQKRFALLIGNQGYGAEVGALRNPKNDVALLDRALTSIGFQVTTVEDAGLASMYQAVNAYVRRLQAAGSGAVGFFYYSGHGAANPYSYFRLIPRARTTPENAARGNRKIFWTTSGLSAGLAVAIWLVH